MLKLVILQKVTKLQWNVLIFDSRGFVFLSRARKTYMLISKVSRTSLGLTHRRIVQCMIKKINGMKGPESEADNLLPPTAEFTTE